MKEIIVQPAITKYQCESCGAQYDDKVSCMKCESKHLPNLTIKHSSFKLNERYPSSITLHDEQDNVDIVYNKASNV